MRIVKIFFICMLFLNNLCMAQIPNFYKESVVSSVKTIFRDQYSAFERNGKVIIKRSTRENEVINYDSLNNVVSFEGWYPKREKYNRLVNIFNLYKRDSLGRIVMKKSVEYYKFPTLQHDTQVTQVCYHKNYRLDSIFNKGELTNVHKRFIDEFGRIKLFENFSSDLNIIERHKYIYDAFGNLSLDSMHTVNDSLCCIRKFVYDKWGNENFVITYSPNGEFLDFDCFEYEYDDRGNWIFRQIYHRGKLVTVVKREFEYLN